MLMLKFKEKMGVVVKNILDGKEIRENINGIDSDTESASLEDPLNLHSSINFVQIKPGALTAGAIKTIWKEELKCLLQVAIHFHVWALYDLVAVVKQLRIPTQFIRLSCADLRWEELPYILKLSNLVLCDRELKNLSCEE